jgi:phosphoribosyl 1,2-cyclic phosphodiesterase
MPVTVTSLASGSSGNATLIRSDRAQILIDAGIGPRILATALRQYGTEPSALRAVAITHEHSDHIKGLAPLVRTGVPIIATPGTASAIDLSRGTHTEIRGDATIEIGDLTLTALRVSHDANEPVAYVIEHADARILILTDLGRFDDAYLPHLAAADLIIIESNHDEAMLRRGPYPPHLKRRVGSDLGHLSNAAAGSALARALQLRTSVPTIWLGHLSEANNRPDLAVTTAVAALAAVGRVAPVMALRRGRASAAWASDPELRPAVQARLIM